MKDQNKIVFVVVIFILSIILFFLHKHTVKEGILSDNNAPANATDITYYPWGGVTYNISESDIESANEDKREADNGWDPMVYMGDGYANEFPDEYNMYQNNMFNPGGGSFGPGIDEGGFNEEAGEGWDGGAA